MNNCDICNGELQHRKATYADPYHFTECGLSYVFLIGVNTHFCPKCDVEVADIPRPDELHLVLAKEILMQPSAMTGEEFRFLRKEIRMRPKEFAELIGVDPKTITNWENMSALSRQNDLTIRFIVAEKLGKTNPKGEFVDLNITDMATSEWQAESAMDAETACLVERSFLGMTNSGWEFGPTEHK
jgi:putative transcriptional regulator